MILRKSDERPKIVYVLRTKTSSLDFVGVHNYTVIIIPIIYGATVVVLS